MRLTDAQVWGAIAGLVVVVFLTRNVFVVVPPRFQPRGAIERALAATEQALEHDADALTTWLMT